MNTTNEQRRRAQLNQRLLEDAGHTEAHCPMMDIAPKIVREEIKARVEANPFEQNKALKKALGRTEPKLWKIYENIAYCFLVVGLLSLIAFCVLTHRGY